MSDEVKKKSENHNKRIYIQLPDSHIERFISTQIEIKGMTKKGEKKK